MRKANRGGLSVEDQQMARAKSALKKKIRNIFTGAGFSSIPISNHEMTIGLRKVEIDSLFIYENIWLLCEDTVKTTGIRDHIRTKNESFGEIKSNLPKFISDLGKLFPEQREIFERYNIERIKIFGLYIPRVEPDLTNADYLMFENLRFIQPQTLSYFQLIVQTIKHSARNEIFRFLSLNSSDIGIVTSTIQNSYQISSIIYPQTFSGIKNNIRVVSFMMSAEDLLNTTYVLRKDNWEKSIMLYQRLIKKEKIKSIREYLINKGETFYNNIIVALPDNIAVCEEDGQYKNIDKVNDIADKCKLVIPNEINSICVIDGQHRIFAYYKSGLSNMQEQRITKLRMQRHLLVTGLIFPSAMPPAERIRIQSEIFLDINSNAKPVPPSVLLQIKRIKDPIADESIAQLVIEKLNDEGIFKKRFQISSLDNAPIKTASIVRFALKYLVTVHPTEGKVSLYTYWDGNKEALQKLDEGSLELYTNYCSNVLRSYFGAIRKHFKEQWDNPDSKLLSVISINGFIIALTRQLPVNGIREFDYYDRIFAGWQYDFSNTGFGYTSSQYRKFSSDILKQVFKISTNEMES